ncbi:arginine deiminase family protein [Tunicatimonas pelagia]|uniref:arginine deiminase family protein n=1 Tax=Tunicatimonas pelagia TaxID=931531 RepID=UPI002665919E|nr:arginine deiminase family protein [Tunicatimonas pelagia]WKN41182.1 arginine deiminase family protein [Tunicatimonas pelagia]
MIHDIYVNSEIGRLKRLLIHSPDAGIGKIVPRIKDQLLYDDIVYLEKMQQEYSEYLRILLCFLDSERIQGKANDPDYQASVKNNWFESDKVLNVERMLVRILQYEDIKYLLVPSVCAIEKCGLRTQKQMLGMSPETLASLLITGILKDEHGQEIILFPPVPNLIFTRDIGITIHDHILLSKPYENARDREALIFKYIAHFELLRQKTSQEADELAHQVIELQEPNLFYISSEEETQQKVVTVEGGDVMMISPGHLLVGLSERTSLPAVEQLVEKLFQRNLIQKVSVVKIPRRRAYMHIDTVFTQVKRDTWIVFSPFTKQEINRNRGFNVTGAIQGQRNIESVHEVEVIQFIRQQETEDTYSITTNRMDYLDDLLEQISRQDFGAKHCEIIPSAGGEFPYSEREQWTDACNFLAVREGVIIGYDRNIKTEKEFRKRGFAVMRSAEIIEQVEQGEPIEEVVTGDTLILLPSGELSRARGGTHCMSMPLLREEVDVLV